MASEYQVKAYVGGVGHVTVRIGATSSSSAGNAV